jgi:hypothetical protein
LDGKKTGTPMLVAGVILIARVTRLGLISIMLVGLDPRDDPEPIEEPPEDGTAERKPLCGGDRKTCESGELTLAGFGGVSGESYASVAIGDRGEAAAEIGGDVVVVRKDCCPLAPPVK